MKGATQGTQSKGVETKWVKNKAGGGEIYLVIYLSGVR